MSLVTRQDILKPEGQKFGIGDLVRVKSDAETEGCCDCEACGGLHRVLGSYFQLHGGDNESEIDEDDYDCPEDLAEEREIEREEFQREKEEYSLCSVEDRESAWAWCDESRMEAVPEDALQGESK